MTADLIGYASRTGTRRNLIELEKRGWRLLLTPQQRFRFELPRWTSGKLASYMLDNGAWSCHTKSISWDIDAFIKCLDVYGEAADWVILPDIVGGGIESLDLSLSWIGRLQGLNLLLPVQDGMTIDLIRANLPPGVGLFVGGSTRWKWSTVDSWSALGIELGAWVHVARVNSARAIHRCHEIGAKSFDGSSLSRYAVNAERLDRARKNPPPYRQLPLLRSTYGGGND